MSMQIKTLVTFESSAFNASEAKDYFVNPECFGDDLARWLIAQLRARGVETDLEPGQEDFGWYFNLVVPEGAHCFVIGYRPGDGKEEGNWIGWLERKRGLAGSLLGLRNRGSSRAAVEAIHGVLANAIEIRNVRWHVKKDFDQGREELGSERP